MPVTRQELTRLLKTAPNVINVRDDLGEFIFMTVETLLGADITVVALLSSNDTVALRTANLVAVPLPAVRPILRRALLEMNLRYKVLKITLDEADGEVCASSTFPLMDASLTAKQVHRILSAIRVVGPLLRARAGHIRDHGVDKDDVDSGADISTLLEALVATLPSTPKPDTPAAATPPAPSAPPRKSGNLAKYLRDDG